MSTGPPQPRETILLVDDEPAVLTMTGDLLRAKGYVVIPTADPREALRLARSLQEPIHLLLTDVVMPEMNGRDLAEQFRRLRRRAKVLFMSAYSTESMEASGFRLPPGEVVLVKPFTVAELDRRVRAVLDS